MLPTFGLSPFPNCTTASQAVTVNWSIQTTSTGGVAVVGWSDNARRGWHLAAGDDHLSAAPQQADVAVEPTAALRRRADERRAPRVVAQEKAAALLLAVLSPDQAQRYRSERRFEVRGSLGGRYEIRSGNAGNVVALSESGEVTARLCAHPELYSNGAYLPDADVALAQMLALTTDEAHFVATANVHWGRRPLVGAA